MGKRFFEATLPELIKQLARVADGLEALTARRGRESRRGNGEQERGFARNILGRFDDCAYVQLMSAISASIQTVLDLFTTSLADVRFADVDGPTLARLAADVEAAAEAVAAAQAALDAARDGLQERQDALLQHAQRALGYARVYAEGDAALSQQIATVSLPRPTRRVRTEDALVLSADVQPASRPRGRPRKAPVAKPVNETMALSATLPSSAE
jgi:hypothetical protein